ncbi:hypothetical protein AB0C42_20455 [Micromonospora taraxaci]|uniref:hypothetical protein n=1 Tax=Micromonospora taraxaci TaxID=1316803 RepID=UPI0033E3774F
MITGAAVLISVSYRAPAGEEQPKVTDWMQAWGTLAGLAAAGAAVALLIHERRKTREERREAERLVPRAVIASDLTFVRNENGLVVGLTLRAHNFGPGAIRHVAALVSPGHGRKTIFVPSVPNILPGKDEPLTRRISPPIDLPPGTLDPHVELIFHDWRGRKWFRPEHVDPEGPPERWSPFTPER